MTHHINIHESTLSPVWFDRTPDKATALVLMHRNTSNERPILLRATWIRYPFLHSHPGPCVELLVAIDRMVINPMNTTRDITAFNEQDTPHLVVYQGPDILPDTIEAAIHDIHTRWTEQDAAHARDLPGRVIEAVQAWAHHHNHWARNGAFLVGGVLYKERGDALSANDTSLTTRQDITINDPDTIFAFPYPASTHMAEDLAETDIDYNEEEEPGWRTCYTVELFEHLLIHIPKLSLDSQHAYMEIYRKHPNLMQGMTITE